MDSRALNTGAFQRRGRFFPLWLAILYFAFAGTSVRSVMAFIAWLFLGSAIWLVETRSRRPRRSFYRLGLVSAFLAWIVAEIATSGGSWLFGTILWLGISVLGLIWTLYYERTETLA